VITCTGGSRSPLDVIVLIIYEEPVRCSAEPFTQRAQPVGQMRPFAVFIGNQK
jgi:hypothetical protein